LKTSFIKEVVYIGKAETGELELEPPPVNIAKIRKQESKAVRLFQEEMARIGVGVSDEAQEIFNALARTYVVFQFFLIHFSIEKSIVVLILSLDYLVHGKKIR
jgi:hypothetical protein